MKAIFVSAIAAVLSFAVLAEDAPAQKHKKIDRARLAAAIHRANGGKIPVPGSQKGEVMYVNCQQAAPKAWLEQHAEAFGKETGVAVKVVDGAFDLAAPKVVGSASIFVVDDPKLPSLLIAPENRWTMVNVAPLKEGRGQKEAFLTARVQKELTRGMAMLCGATSSNYPQSLTGCVTKSEQLDKFQDNRLPLDVVRRYEEYLAGYGVTPLKMETYKKACEQGWAPQPQDEDQKRIWDQIHTLPTNPIPLKHQKK